MSAAPSLSAPAAPSFLEEMLLILDRWLGAQDVSEIACNGPGVVWVERAGEVGMTRYAVPELTAKHIERLAKRAAGASGQVVGRERPLLSTSLPGGERIQCVLPPICAAGAFSIRKQIVRDLSSAQLAERGFFTALRAEGGEAAENRHLQVLHASGDMQAFLAEAVRLRRNILISGGTSTAKTTLLNALAKEIPWSERLLTIEDTREVHPPHENHLALVASRGDQGEAQVDMRQLLSAALRLRPDRILLGEIRGSEALTFLQAISSGHRGSLSTIHADSPLLALERLALLAMEAGMGLEREEIHAHLRVVIDVVVQLVRTADGRRGVSEVQFLGASEGVEGGE